MTILLPLIGLMLMASVNAQSVKLQIKTQYDAIQETQDPVLEAFNASTKIIRYFPDNSLTNAEKDLVQAAYDAFGVQACGITVIRLANTSGVPNTNYVKIVKTNDPTENGFPGNSASNPNPVTIKFNKDGNYGNFLFAIALASFQLPTEHLRNDRDDYLTFDANADLGAYPKDPNNNLEKFEYDSVMMIDNPYDATGDNLGFIGYLFQTKEKIDAFTIGQSNYVTFLDRKKARLFYSCQLCSPNTCQNGGYAVMPACTCVCPPGFTGATCTDIASSVPTPGLCGGEVVVTQCVKPGTKISLPNFVAGQECTWRVSTTAGSGLIFAFERRPTGLQVSPFAETCGDNIFIREFGDTKYPGKKFCTGGVNTGRIFETDNNQALVHFRSVLGQNSASGFDLVAYSTCNGTTPAQFTKQCVFTTTGYDYVGSLNVAADNSTCLPWPATSPEHLKGFRFPDGDYDASQNLCRNPNSNSWIECQTASGLKPCSQAPAACVNNPEVDWIRCVRYDNQQYQGCQNTTTGCKQPDEFQLGGLFSRQRCEKGVAVRCFRASTNGTRCINHNMKCDPDEITFIHRFRNYLWFDRNHVACMNYAPAEDHVRCVYTNTTRVADCRKFSLGCHDGETMVSPAYPNINRCYARLLGPLNTPY